MVLTRSMCKTCASIGSGADATTNASNSSHGADTVVHGDTTRVAVDKHASARSRRTKSNSALQTNISTEDKSARTRTRAAVPKADKGERPIGRKSSLQKQHRARRSGNTGTKRNRETNEDAPESEAAPRANARRVRRKVDGPADRSEQCNTIMPKTSPVNDCDAGSSCKIPRRPARLAFKSQNAIPHGHCSSTDDVDRVVGWRNQNRRKRTRIQERCEDAFETTSSRRIRRRICEVASQSNVRIEGRTSGSATETESSEGTPDGSRSGSSIADRPERFEEGSSSVPSIKNEDIDQDWLLVVDHERHTSIDSVTSAYRESTEPRSSSVESLPTPPPPCMEEEEQVLLHQDFDAMFPLDSVTVENDLDAINQAYLRQLQDRRPNDEADVEAEMAANRYRSLAPEPDQGLVDAIRSGRISRLASPERSMREE